LSLLRLLIYYNNLPSYRLWCTSILLFSFAGGVGKSALSIQFVRNLFVREYNPTIEESYRKQVTIDGTTCMLDILDTAGQEEFSSLRHQYMRQGQGFLCVYSITDKASFEELQTFHSEVYRVKEDELPRGQKIPIIIVGNKCDLENQRVVTTDQGQEFAKRNNCLFIETSAATRSNVEEAYFSLVRKIREIQPKQGRSTQNGQKEGPWGNNTKKGFSCVIL